MIDRGWQVQPKEPVSRSETSSRPILLYGGTVLTMDAEARVFANAEVLIDQGRVAGVGRALTVLPGTQIIDIGGCFVLPGLVQGHVHLGQTFFRGLAEDRKLLAWLRERIWPLEAAHDDESAYWCSLMGAAECLLGGTTTIQDIGLGPGAEGVLRAVVESRLRAIAGKCLMDTGEGMPAALVEDTDRTLAHSEALGDAFDGAGGGRLGYAVNPRFILSCTEDLWRGLRELSTRRGWPIHTHALEQREEGEIVRALKQGRSEVEYFSDLGILDADLRIAHGVQLEPEHYPRLQQAGASVVHCPSSNLKLGSGVADVVALRGAGVRVGLGCDGAPCNNDLDAFEELRLAALLQKLHRGPESFSGRDALRLATNEGAAAIGLGGDVGRVEIGCRADLVVLSADRPELWAAANVDPHDLVAFGACRGHVRHVFVEGEQLVENGRLTHLDLDEIQREAGRCLKALLKRSGLDF